MTERGPGHRAGLTHDRVVEVARRLLAEKGVDRLTMRALADRLGVAPNAVYSYVGSKAELIDDVLDDVLAGVVAVDPEDGKWWDGLHALMSASHAVLMAHPDLVPLFVARRGARGANAQRLGAVMLDLLARGGVEGASAREAQRALIVYTIGSAAFAAGDGDALPAASGFPGVFDAGLRWLLAGITSGPPA